MMHLSACLASAVLAWAQANPDLGAELRKLEEEYRKGQQAFYDALRAAATEEEQTRLFLEKHPDKLFLPRFQDLARRAKGTPPAAGALVHVFRLAYAQPNRELPHEVLKEMVASHLDSPLIEHVAAGVPDAPYHEGFPGLLGAIQEKSPHRAVRAGAQFALGLLLLRRQGAPAKDLAEGRRLLAGVTKDFADTSYGKLAEGRLFELDHLQVGKTPPDFEATDQDGKAFKLSDYRGKVVVVDFWGFW